MSAEWMSLPSFVTDLLTKSGVRLDEALRRAAVPARPFHDGKLRMSAEQFLAFWIAIESLGAPADFGLTLASKVPTDQHDVASIAALHSASFGEAISRLVRYKRLTCPETIETEERGRELRLRFRWGDGDSPQPPLLIDSAFAWIAQLAGNGLGRTVRPLRIEVSRKRGNQALLKAHFGCPLTVGAARDLIVFDVSLSKEPFRTHNESLLEIMLPGLESALAARDAQKSLMDHVKVVVTRQMSGQRPSIGTVASELRVSPRTLQRRLEDLGTSYQQLLDQVRSEVARRLLASTDLEAGEIAFFLGYEELNSFARAFHGWEGTTPARWREAAKH
jgi:AraC-like DNA-binding protein